MIYFTMRIKNRQFIKSKNLGFIQSEDMILNKAENIEKINEITQSCADSYEEEVYVHFYKFDKFNIIRPTNFVEFSSLKKGDMFSFNKKGYENYYKHIKISDTEYMIVICPEYQNEQKYTIFSIENKNDLVLKIER